MKENKLKLGVPSEEGQVSFAFKKGGSRQGAGRKGIGETRKLSLTLSPALWDELDAYCVSRQCSRSEAIRGMVEAHFLNL